MSSQNTSFHILLSHILEGIMQPIPYENDRQIAYFSGKCYFNIRNTIFFRYI